MCRVVAKAGRVCLTVDITYRERSRDYDVPVTTHTLRAVLVWDQRGEMDVGAGDGIPTFDLRIESADAESGSLKLTQLIRPEWSIEHIKLKVSGFSVDSNKAIEGKLLFVVCKM